LPDLPRDLHLLEGQTKRTEFARVRGKLMKREMQGQRQGRFKLDVWSWPKDFSTICRVGKRALLYQLSKLRSATAVARELAETVKIGNPGYQLYRVIFDTRRLRLPDHCFDHRQQISNSVLELGEEKGHGVSAQT
jgi:hypothetical protein